MQKLLKILLLVISLSWHLAHAQGLLQGSVAQSEKPSDIGYGEPEETDFC